MTIDFSKYKNKKVCIACSGGADSMCLLHLFLSNAKQHLVEFCVVNVEHGIREESSIKDSLFVEEYCKKNGIEFLGYKVDALTFSNQNKTSLEEGARILRYQCFERALKESNAHFVATAHHKEDNAETVLFNLFRGTGLTGLTGITDTDKFIRPLISFTKEQILNYLASNGVDFVTDETNFSNDYTRNRLRNVIFPQIKEDFPQVDESIFRLSKIAQEDNDCLFDMSKKLIEKCSSVIKVGIDNPKSLLSRAIILAMWDLGIKKDYTKTHIDDVCSLVLKENGSSINLPQGIVAVREYDKICLYKKETTKDYEFDFYVGEIKLNDKILIIESVEKRTDEKGVLFVDGSLLLGAKIRNKRFGDTFNKFGGNSKKLCDYLTDKKIPIRERNQLPLICKGSEVLVVCGIEISESVKVTEQTKKIYKIQMKGE